MKTCAISTYLLLLGTSEAFAPSLLTSLWKKNRSDVNVNMNMNMNVREGGGGGDNDQPTDGITKRTSSKDQFPAIHKYLQRSDLVEPVPLPEKFDEDEKYCPLILDGASGVGKTQQAFALLKKGSLTKGLVYVLMTPGNESKPQQIYKEMRYFAGMNDEVKLEIDGNSMELDFLELLDEAMKEAERTASRSDATNRAKEASDPFSLTNIELILSSDYYIATVALKAFLYNRVLTCTNENNGMLQIKKYPSQTKLSRRYIDGMFQIKEYPSQTQLSSRSISLKNMVLFIDEALPPSSDDERSEVVYNRLRFLRNFGRVSGMRTVLAGTAATAANINKWAVPPATSSSMYTASRHSAADVLWAEVQFIDPHVDHHMKVRVNNSDPSSDETAEVKVRVRPLLKEWLSSAKPHDSIASVVRSIRDKINNSKHFSNTAKLIWLSGAWLDSLQNSCSPFQLKSADLIRSHFFEPAIPREKDGDEDGNLYLGKGILKYARHQGPLRLQVMEKTIYEHMNEQLVWALVLDNEDTEQRAAGVSYEFCDIEYTLSHNIQQCLGMEPLLAVALLTLNWLSIEEFQESVAKAFPQTLAQSTKGGLDGELNELVMFAALQLACNTRDNEIYSDAPSKLDLQGFIHTLHDYLQVNPKDNLDAMVKVFGENMLPYKKKKKNSNLTIEYKADDNASDACEPSARDKSLFHETKMPWLVPACSLEKLQDAYGFDTSGVLNDFFENINIAGLILGINNSSMDAKAYKWGKEIKKMWAFEFKCQKDYTLRDGRRDLVKKCRDLVKKCDDSQVINSDDEEPEEKVKCHGMLIAISGSSDSCCEWWVEDGKFLRVVLVVSNSPYSSKF